MWRRIFLVFLGFRFLDKVRGDYSRLERTAAAQGWGQEMVDREQKWVIVKAGLIYGFFLSFIILFLFISLTEKIVNVYTGVTFLQTNAALITQILLSYLIAVVSSSFIIKWYVSAAHPIAEAGGKVGRGAKQAFRATGAVKNSLVKGVKVSGRMVTRGVEKSFNGAAKVGKKTGHAGKQAVRATLKGVRKGKDIAVKGGRLGLRVLRKAQTLVKKADRS